MIQVTRKKQETTISLLKRFNRRVKHSSRLIKFKKTQFKERQKSDLKIKREALKKLKKIESLKQLYKMGKIDNPPQE